MVARMVRGLTYAGYVELRDVEKDEWVVIYDQPVLVLAVEHQYMSVRVKYRVVGADKTRYKYTASPDTEIMRIAEVFPRRGQGVVSL